MTRVMIADIRRETLCQPRGSLDSDLIGHYAVDMHGGAVFPAVTVYSDGETFWLADGFHRLEASSRIGKREIEADVRTGTMRDAILYAVQANATHGLRRSNDDKRRSVEILLRDDEWAQWSNREIARRCGVSDLFVSSVRGVITANVCSDNDSRSVKYTDRWGKPRTMDTAKIGRRATMTVDRDTGEVIDDDESYPEVEGEEVDPVDLSSYFPPPRQPMQREPDPVSPDEQMIREARAIIERLGPVRARALAEAVLKVLA